MSKLGGGKAGQWGVAELQEDIDSRKGSNGITSAYFQAGCVFCWAGVYKAGGVILTYNDG